MRARREGKRHPHHGASEPRHGTDDPCRAASRVVPPRRRWRAAAGGHLLFQRRAGRSLLRSRLCPHLPDDQLFRRLPAPGHGRSDGQLCARRHFYQWLAGQWHPALPLRDLPRHRSSRKRHIPDRLPAADRGIVGPVRRDDPLPARRRGVFRQSRRQGRGQRA